MKINLKLVSDVDAEEAEKKKKKKKKRLPADNPELTSEFKKMQEDRKVPKRRANAVREIEEHVSLRRESGDATL